MLLGIHNQQYIDPGIGEFKPPTGGLGIDNHLFNPPHQGQLGIGSLPNFSDKIKKHHKDAFSLLVVDSMSSSLYLNDYCIYLHY